MAKVGAPSKKDTIPKEQLEKLFKAGWTDKQVSDFYGITEVTFNNWKKKDPKFFKSVKDWKIEADNKIERSLFERAHGYTCPDTKAQWVSDKDGSRWEYAEMRKHYAPDPTSMIFWLKNRQPEKWRDKHDHNLTGDLTINVQRFSDES